MRHSNMKRKLQLALVTASAMFVACLLISFRVVLLDVRDNPNPNPRFKNGRGHGNNRGLRNNPHHATSRLDSVMNTVQQSLFEFSQDPRKGDSDSNTPNRFTRYSQRYQKDPESQQLLDEKHRQYQQQQDSDTMRGLWQGFQDLQTQTDQTSSSQHNKLRVGYRPGSRRKRRYDKILYFLHIHKSAGSTFCKQAYLNRISANYNNNCNIQADQHCCGNNDTVQAQIDYAKNSPYDLVAAEQEMYESFVPQAYDYIVSLRNSRRRYYSHWNHLCQTAQSIKDREWGYLQKQVEREKNDSTNATTTTTVTEEQLVMEWVNVTIGNDNLVQAAQDPVHWNLTIRDYNSDGAHVVYPVGNFTKWHQGQPDNYNVRMICGVKCLKTPKYQLTRELFEYTLQRLAQFAHIIFVEDLNESFAKFAKAYGWLYNPGTAAHHHHHKGHRLNASDLTAVLENQVQWDPYMSVLDDALYEFAQRKYDQVSGEELWNATTTFANQALVDEYFRLGPSRGCLNECCGVCSKW